MNTTKKMILSPGEQIAGFRIITPVAAGGMAVVYEAEQVRLKRRVALKVLNDRLGRDDSYRERFVREGTHIASLEHPHIIPVYDAGEQDGRLFIAMRYVDGQTLGDLLADHRMSAEEIDRILRPIAGALDVAHNAGIVHRDIKPGNILIDTRGHSFLADFGIARAKAATYTLTSAGSFVGSVHYASPEQVRGEALTHASDIYSLAVVYYQCIAGDVPFRSDTESSILDAHLTAPFPAISAENGGTEELNAVLQKGLAKDPGERFPTATELADAVAGAIAGRPSTGGVAAAPPLPGTQTDGPTPATEGPTPIVSRPTPIKPLDPAGMGEPVADPNGTMIVDATTVDPRGDEPPAEEEPSRKRSLPNVNRSALVIAGAAAVAIGLPLAAVMASGSSDSYPVSHNGLTLYSGTPLVRTSSAAAEQFGLVADKSVVYAKDGQQLIVGPYAEKPDSEGGLPSDLAKAVKSPPKITPATTDGKPAVRFSAVTGDEQFGSLEGVAFNTERGSGEMVMCMQPSRAGTSSGNQCGELLDTIQVSRTDLAPIAPTAAAEARLEKLLDQLAADSKGLGLTAKDRNQRAKDAEKLAAAYATAGKAAADPGNVSPREKQLFKNLSTALDDTATALKRLAIAASAKNYSSYARQVKAIESGQRNVNAAVESFNDL